MVIQADALNRSKIQTVLVDIISGNIRLGVAPGNVFLPADASRLQASVDAGLRVVLEL
jgi:mRNA interferase MazF